MLIYFTKPAFLAIRILSYHKTCTCHAQECAEGEYQSLPRETGSVFCCVVGLYPDNLQEAWGSGRERLINIADSSFIHGPIPAGTGGSYVFTQEKCHARMDEGVKLLAPA